MDISDERKKHRDRLAAAAKQRATITDRKMAVEISRREFVPGSAPPAEAKAILDRLKEREAN